MDIGKIEQLTTTQARAALLVRASRLLRKFDIGPDTLLMALEFKQGKSIVLLAEEYGITDREVQDAIREVMRRT